MRPVQTPVKMRKSIWEGEATNVDMLYHEATTFLSVLRDTQVDRMVPTVSCKTHHDDGQEALRNAQRKHEVESHEACCVCCICVVDDGIDLGKLVRSVCKLDCLMK